MNRTAIYCGTRNLYHHMVTSAKSMLYHNGADTIWFLIEDDDFPEQLPSCVRTMNVSGQKYFPKDGPNYKSRWSYMILMRTVLTKLFPNLDKALIIDVDTIVCDDISECLPLFLSVLTLCLFRVRYILERSICSASDVPYLSHSHYPSPRFGLRNSISIAF